MQIIDGKTLSQNIYSEITQKLSENSIKPKLAIILASDDESSLMYDHMKTKKAEELGITSEIIQFEQNSSADQIIEKIKELNQDTNFTGIMVQLPLFQHLEKDRDLILNTINQSKDVDGLTITTLGKIFIYQNNDILPATVDAILECLRFSLSNNLFELQDKNVLIINNSNLIGKPLGVLLEKFNATVTIANEFTKDLSNLTQNADIIISATGKTNLIDHKMIKGGVTLIDVTSKRVNDKVIGDVVRSTELDEKAAFLTPVPGGVGPLTIACLLRNLVNLK